MMNFLFCYRIIYKNITEGGIGLVFFKNLFIVRCPSCKEILETHKSDVYKSVVIKSCPKKHYQKEFHPALEMYIESKI
jgi:phage FluMu protein Com